MTSETLRIISLIPSATEIVAHLGFTAHLVGRSHECDYPPQVEALPICTRPRFDPEGTSAEIHDRVTELLQSALSVYHINTEAIAQLQPTHIITQAQCEVCAASLSEVEQAVATLTQTPPQVISLQPSTLADVWDNLRQVAVALEADPQQAIAPLQERIETCRRALQQSTAAQPTVACIEWIEPLMAAGNWVPELVTMAGGRSLFGTVGEHSPWLKWEKLQAANPDVIIVMPCGYNLEKTHQEMQPLLQKPEWASLQAVQTGQVYLTDGNQYFNRPGPRLVDSLELLAEILHPELVQFGYEGQGWVRLEAAAL